MSVTPMPPAPADAKAYTNDQAGLQRHLADTIGADVERALNSVDWQHTQTPPGVPPLTPPAEGGVLAVPANPVPAVTPQPSQPPVPPSQPLDWEQFKDPATGLILGKYKDPLQAAKGMHSLLHMAKEALATRDRAVIEADQLRQRQASPLSVVAAPQSVLPVAQRPAEITAILAKVKENNGTLDAEDLEQMLDATVAHAQQAAQKAVEEDRKLRSFDNQKWSEVDEFMTTNHPDSMRHGPEMQLFASTKPEVGRIYNRILSGGDETARLDATVYLWGQYAAANPHAITAPGIPAPVDPAKAAQEHALNVQAQVRKDEVDAARAQAGLLGTGASGAHEAAPAALADREAVERAAAMMKQLGAPGQGGALWRSLTITKDLNHPIFGS